MLDTALNSFTNLALRASVRDDDGIDQLHHFVTVTILAFFGAITGFVEYAGQPINCWNYGNYLWGHYQDHVNKYCWAHSLYHYPNSSDWSIMPYELNDKGYAKDPSVLDKPEEELGQITFFRWVTIIFIVQALLFKLPNVFWTEVNSSSGSNIVKMVEMLQGVLFATKEDKREKLEQVALFLEQWLRIHRKPHWFLKSNVNVVVKKTLSCCTLCIGDNTSNYLSTLYLLTKLVFLLNNFFQFILLSVFLQINFWDFGVKTLKEYSDKDMMMATTDTFPTVALCHFKTYDKKNPLGNWVQCILTINIFLEKLFLIEWFWLLLLLVITSISLAVWCFKILQTQTAIKFVRSYMKLMGVYSPSHPVPEHCSVEQFVTEYLRNDGVFILRILAVNTNEVVVAQLVEELWTRYLTFEEKPNPAGLEMREAESPLMKEKAASPAAV
ncbi:innexin unc-9-like [Babylonia areolata]|uniref:innexin unc-9-like n=1 Tax=Babylonia areolata TaxID=304850 RepID=UPI003FD3E8BB